MMKKEKLYEAVGEIDDVYIRDAHIVSKKESGKWLKWVAVAACLCLVAVGAFMASMKNQEKSRAYAQTVIYNNAEYVVCGEGEGNILKECGLPAEITKDLAGEHIGYLVQAEKSTYYVEENLENSETELLEYAPQPNSNVYIVRMNGRYYAAIRRDAQGYHGLTDNG